MKFIDRPNVKQGKYDNIIDAVAKLTPNNALELQGIEYDQVISIRTMIWVKYGSGACMTKYNKHTKELIIWKN